MWSNGNSFSGSPALGASAGQVGGEGGRWPVPSWRFGLRQSDDRGNI